MTTEQIIDGVTPDRLSAALKRINGAGVSESCRRLARETYVCAFRVLGSCSVFWDEHEDSITFMDMTRGRAIMVLGDLETPTP